MARKIKDKIEEKMELWQVQLLQEFYNKFRKALREKDEQYFQFIRAGNKSKHSDRTEFIKKIFGEMPLKEFVIEEEINSCYQYLGDIFFKDVYTPVCKESIRYSVLDNYSIGEYKLSGDVNSLAIQKETSILPEKEKRFWAMLDVLAVNLKFGQILFGYELQKDKVYFLHFKRNSKKIFAVRLAFYKDKWEFRSRDFQNPISWGNKGNIFLYLIKITSKAEKL